MEERCGWIVCFVCLAFIAAGRSQQLTCRDIEVSKCLEDNVNGVPLLEFAAVIGSITTTTMLTQELCAAMCARYNYTIFGVEQGYQCFCGNSYAYAPSTQPMSDCNTPCTENKNESCGGTNRLLIFSAICNGTIAPTGHACLDEYTQTLPFCDVRKSVEDRVADLVSRLTLDEKLGMLGPDINNTNVDTCNCMTAGVPRLGIPNYMQIVETNSAVAAACFGPEKCSTVFPGPTGMAASFNRTLWNAKGQAISDEMRAYNNLNWYRGYELPHALMGLLGFGPNINIIRDPRFGRNSELPSEDPFLAGSYAIQYVQGCQVGSDARYFKMIAGLKHYACYSIETDRMSRNVNVSTFDLWDTYLPQYEMGFTTGNAQAVMCSYASVNGVPSCANDYLMNKVVRGKWGRSDLLIGTDCGAIGNMVTGNMYASNNTDAAAKTMNGGSDVNIGDPFFSPVENGGNGALPNALALGWVSIDSVNEAVTRALTKRYLTGQFDPLESQIYTKLGAETINSTANQQLNLEAALQSFVLLKNSDNVLPFPEGKKLAVVGPHAYSTRDLMEDYSGDQRCFGGSDNCVRTIAEVFTTMHGTENTVVVKGVDMDSTNATDIPAALAAVEGADYVVLCIGIGYTQEHEGIDRINISLPGLQEMFALKVLAAGKPTVVVLINGGIVAIDSLVAPAPAIIEAFYPSLRGAEALYLSIFGYENRWGKLPVTIYSSDFINEQSMFSFDMTTTPGRTYKYYTGTPLFTFGSGLSYTTFAISCAGDSSSNLTTVDLAVENTGSSDGDEVIMVFHRVSQTIAKSVPHPVPFRSLVEFTRVTIPKGSTTKTQFAITWDKLTLTDENGNQVLYPGTHYLDFTDSVAPTCTVTVQV